MNPLQAAFGFVSGISDIDQVVCGVNDAGQFREICEAAQVEVDFSVFAEFAITDEAIVNPALWKFDKVMK